MAQTNYKCGISYTYSGTEGVDWAEEYFYHDRLISDRRAVWIKSGTQISLTHNQFNVSRLNDEDGLRAVGQNPATIDYGTIRYKVDMDLAPKWRWYKSTGVNQLPAYSSPLTFGTLQFPGTAVNVLGATGPVPGFPITDRTNYYYRGMLDVVGDEWHTLTVADDDSANYTQPSTADSQYKASDGRVMPYVVNPKTPHFNISSTGNAQFFTRSPKVYFVPKIHEMTTWIAPRSGGISIILKSLTGEDVFWRIGGGGYTNGGATVSLTDANFADGSNTLQYYFNASFIRTRVVIKNPTSPSAGESHGNLFWKDSAELTRIQSRITSAPYLTTWNLVKTNASQTQQGTSEWNDKSGKGYRIGGSLISNIGYQVQAAFNNAFCALNLGWTAKRAGTTGKTFAQFAKEMLLENVRQLDSVGSELNNAAEACPSGEINYRGYWDADFILDLIGAYDLLCEYYREDQYADGLTPIEELKIRDDLAAFVVECLQWMGGGRGNMDAPEMWGFSRNVAALAIAINLSTYSNSTYGTSGFDGNTTSYTWTPYPVASATWKVFLLDDTFPLTTYPEPMWRIGILGNGAVSLIQVTSILGDNQWLDRIYYLGWSQMGKWMSQLLNLASLHTAKTYPNLEAMMLRCADGTIQGLKDTMAPLYVPQIQTYNDRFPALALEGLPTMLTYPSTDNNSESKQLADNKTFALIYYDNTSANDNVSDVIATPPAGTYESPQSVELYCPTPSSTIHYTTNGAAPTVGSPTYTVPIAVNVPMTIKAFAVATGLDDGNILTAVYQIDTSGVPAAPTNLLIVQGTHI